MVLRLLPWSPEYGSGMQFDSGAEAERPAEVDVTLEGAWRARAPRPEPRVAIQVVDGVRRAEAHALDEVDDGQLCFGLFGSFAIGAVRCAADGARILDETIRVERRYLQSAGAPQARELRGGGVLLRFRAELAERATSANDLVATLNQTMLDAEAHLAESLSHDESTLTLVDGPLRLRAPGQRVVGYVKRVHRWYLGGEQQRLLLALAVGERTPLFRIVEQGSHDRISWYLRIADLSAHYHPLAGVLRLEVPGALPKDDAARLADQSAVALPRLASSPVRDPRSPQNLLPVGALEVALTHRLGDRRWVARLLAAAVAREVAA